MALGVQQRRLALPAATTGGLPAILVQGEPAGAAAFGGMRPILNHSGPGQE